MTKTLDQLRVLLSDSTHELGINLSKAIQSEFLSIQESHGVAYCSALFIEDGELASAIRLGGEDELGTNELEDAKAVSAIMTMNSIYFRFRHMLAKDSYNQMRAGIRMGRMKQPSSSKKLMEFMALACAALAGCEVCIQSHESSLLEIGASESQINDAARIAAVVKGFSNAIKIER